MSKKHRNLREMLGLSGDQILGLLQTRANSRAGNLGHMIGLWYPAKKKYGKAAKHAYCLQCGRKAVIAPYGNPQGPKIAQWGPVVLGSAVFEPCPETPKVRPDAPVGQTHDRV